VIAPAQLYELRLFLVTHRVRHFEVKLSNASDRVLRVIWPQNRWADEAYFFEWRRDVDAEAFPIVRQPQAYSVHLPSVKDIEPNGERSLRFDLLDEAWDVANVPERWDQTGLIRACYKVQSTDHWFPNVFMGPAYSEYQSLETVQ
jgi:hypothetical protein